MAKHGTGIQWTHVPGYRGDTWNPTTGCTRVSPGCDHCYAFAWHDKNYLANDRAVRAVFGKEGPPLEWGETRAQAGRRLGVKLPFPAQYDVPFSRVQLLGERRLTEPLRRRAPTAYFVDSMSDIFHEDVPDEYLDRVFAVMALSPQHLFMVLTKRPERMREYLSSQPVDRWRTAMEGMNPNAIPQFDWLRKRDGWPLPNVWLGTSVEDQERAHERLPHLVQTPAAVLFVSLEPLLEPVDISLWMYSGYDEPPFTDRISWAIVGGESGRGARPMMLDWARSIRDQCRAADVAFFMKQSGRYGSWQEHERRVWCEDVRGFNCTGLHALKVSDGHGGKPEEWPEDLRIREWPAVLSAPSAGAEASGRARTRGGEDGAAVALAARARAESGGAS